MNRYNAVTGRMERVPEPEPVFVSSPPATVAGTGRKPSTGPGRFGGLDGILKKFNIGSLETEDLILVGIFYLLYRESGDIEFLLIAGAMLFL